MKLLSFDTIIFDLDFTVWDGYKPLFWAKLLKSPYKLDGNKFYGISEEYIQLQDNISEILKILYGNKKNIGFASRGADEHAKYEDQPTIIALKSFGIYKYFNYQKILVFKDVNKASLLKPLGNTVYIDDNSEDLKQVHMIHGDSIKIINRNAFNNWRSII
jgi:predicted phosphatase